MDYKKLFKSRNDRKVAGVCGGIAEYIDIDSTLIRLVWVLLVFCAGTGFLAYIIAAIVMPDESANYNNNDNYYNGNNNI